MAQSASTLLSSWAERCGPATPKGPIAQPDRSFLHRTAGVSNEEQRECVGVRQGHNEFGGH